MLIGHQKIVFFLASSIKKNRLAHAYLFLGPDQVGKKTLALSLAKALECDDPEFGRDKFSACGRCKNCLQIEKMQHPDVFFVEPAERTDPDNPQSPVKSQEIKIDQARRAQHHLSLSPFYAKYKIVIIDGANHLNQEAANCFLKTLEEPTPKSLIILIGSGSQLILPTLISRCQLIKFLPIKKEMIARGLEELGFRDRSKIEKAVRLCCGRPGAAIKLLQDARAWKESEQAVENLERLLKKDLAEKFRYARDLSQDNVLAQETLEKWIIWFRDQILADIGVGELMVSCRPRRQTSGDSARAIKRIQLAKDLLSDSSFNSRLILENLMLKL